MTSKAPLSKNRSPFSKILNLSAPAGEKTMSSTPIVAVVRKVKIPPVLSKVKRVEVTKGVVTEVAKVGLATVLIGAQVPPAPKVITVPPPVRLPVPEGQVKVTLP
ncbi:MAG: hypothetical protein DDT18_01464 [Actinobacteria bacterium]|nr:hypothetical protein [Actinomycetota bacterium]